METSSWNAAVRQNTNFLIFKSALLEVRLLELWRKIWQLQLTLEYVDTHDIKKTFYESQIVRILQCTNVN